MLCMEVGRVATRLSWAVSSISKVWICMLVVEDMLKVAALTAPITVLI